MNTRTSQSGHAIWIILIIVVVLVVAGFLRFGNKEEGTDVTSELGERTEERTTSEAVEEDEDMVEGAMEDGEHTMEEGDAMMQEGDDAMAMEEDSAAMEDETPATQ